MNGDEPKDLIVGANSVKQGIQKIHPNLTDEEANQATNIVLNEVGIRIGGGEKLGFIKSNEDGTSELTILGMNIFNKGKQGD